MHSSLTRGSSRPSSARALPRAVRASADGARQAAGLREAIPVQPLFEQKIPAAMEDAVRLQQGRAEKPAGRVSIAHGRLSLIRVLRVLALLWAACLGSAAVMAQALPFQVEAAYAQESSEASNPDGLAQATFTAYGGELIQAFPATATWIRLTITPRKALRGGLDSPAGDGLYTLRIGPSNFQRVDLFEPSAAGWSQRTDQGFHSDREYRCLDGRHCFKLERIDEPARTVYVRVLSPGALRIQVEVLGSTELLSTAVQQMRMITRSLTVCFCLLCLSIYLLAVDRSALMLTFVLFQCTIIVNTACMTGLLGEALAGRAIDLSLLAFASMVGRTLMILLLCLAFLRQHQPTRAYLMMAGALIAAAMASLVLVAGGQAQLALAWNLATWTALPLTQIYGAASSRHLNTPLRRMFLAVNVVLAAFTAAALKTLFWPEASDANLLLFTNFSDIRLNGLWVSAVFFTVVILERHHQARVRQAAFDALQLEAQASRQAEAQLSERSSLIDMLTHELKNPLSTIRLAAESLGGRWAADQDGQRRVRAIQSCVTRMDKLIEHVAHANKIEMLPPAPQADAVAAQTIVTAVIQQLGLEDRVACHVQPSATFAAEPQMIRVVFENLLENASTYGLADEPIELSVSSQPDGTTRIVVSNGVAPGSMPDPDQIFTRYYRHTQAQVHPGMGIGLSLVRSTVIKIGGTIEYRPGDQRVAFIIRIPS